MIELIMVIVILGVLSAFALPRFADLGGDARSAAVDGAAGAIRSAMGITRAAAFASGVSVTSETPLDVNLDGQNISTILGYPVAGDGTSPSALGIVLAAGFIQPGDSIESLDDPVTPAVANVSAFRNGDFIITSPSAGVVSVGIRPNCAITYTQASGLNDNGTPADPSDDTPAAPATVTQVTSGC